ncbi:potassium transporter Kup [Pseudorhodoplanes sp.]|uniref:potassium transporter Kup n=1 Tax=Pseudorhodoplanes sp. TaxID=1934341 RepID=UPI002D09EA61|nr:potassium transporter Kup [Pseudorhodoplanes sp.]HWM83106.1 potassium transporter Kup [Pseudolabrys sp.]HWV51767.1 potassium transporter Kup [Pseudorhodoplanes sp.]
MSNGLNEAAPPDAVVENETPAPVGFWALSLGSVGVVYGDIGTSPLYAFREAVRAASENGVPTRATVLGVLSLIVWSLVITVTLKYVLILLRADNNGEGGTLSLTALATRGLGRRTVVVFILGIIGASMFLGDSVITPAISVLSAVEGLQLAVPSLTDYVVPIALVILVLLFAAQSHGTARVAAFFGPVMTVWFLAIAVSGLLHISDDPQVLYAINPVYAVEFVLQNGHIGLIALGAVFLCVTGGEALYADLGHFGRKPIQVAWLGLILPSLLLNYFGQGAKVLSDPAAIENPFFLLLPEALLLPMVILATAATVIASQAVITGAYSLVHQAIQLGLLPRLAIQHTSASHVGQIYIPRVTVALFIGVMLLVGLFRTSSALSHAYGIAVATTMVVDGLLAFLVAWKLWQMKFWQAALMMVPLIFVDAVFFSANLLKLLEGAWVPILFGIVMVLLILTWRRGTNLLSSKTRRTEVPLETLLRSLNKKLPHLVPGTAVFFTSTPDFAPTALLHNLKHNKVLHENNVILTIHVADTPRVKGEDRVRITPVNERFQRVVLKFGYMESPNVPKALAIARKHGWQFDIMSTSFFLSRRALKPSPQSEMPRWQDRLFIGLARTSSDASEFFQIPTGRVVEIGTQVAI